MFKLKVIFVVITSALVFFLASKGEISKDLAVGWVMGICVGVGFSELVQRMRR
jgi:ABC-type Mn2+/Zn2+ transport system permease subunit